MPDVTLRPLVASVFLPVLVFEIGSGAVTPVIALTALSLGASTALAGLVLAMMGIGQILGSPPSSFLVSRLGDRRAMMVAAAVATGVFVVCFLAPGLPLFGLAVTVVGMCNATFYLARQHYVVEVVPPTGRALALSTLGGVHRIGMFLGPFVGAAVIELFSMQAAYLVAGLAAAATVAVLVANRDRDEPHTQAATTAARLPLRAVLKSHRDVYLTLGLAVLAVGAVRSARQTAIPLWAAHIGLDATTVSIIFGVASAVDMVLFYPAGRVMDQYGRLAVAIPSMTILGAATAALALTHDTMSLTLCAMVMSFGNGLGSGIIMTLGADAAPADARVGFLAIWRTMTDTGSATGPLVLASVAAMWTLGAGIVAIGSVGLLAALALRRWVPRYSAYATRQMVQAARGGIAT